MCNLHTIIYHLGHFEENSAYLLMLRNNEWNHPIHCMKKPQNVIITEVDTKTEYVY